MHARGDVELKLDGQTFQLRGDFGNMADYQSALGVVGLMPVLEMLSALDARALLRGVQCLAIKGDVDIVRGLNFSGNEAIVQEKLLEAITGSTLTGQETDEPDPNPKGEGK